MKKLIIPFLAIGFVKVALATELQFKLSYPVITGSMQSSFSDSTPLSLIFGTDNFSFSTNKLKNSFQLGATLQTDALGYYMEAYNSQYKVNDRTYSITKGADIPFTYKYNVGRGSVGLSKKFETSTTTLRIGGGIRIVSIGITRSFGTTGFGFITDDRDTFRMPELRLTLRQKLTENLSFQAIAGTGLSNNCKTYNIETGFIYKFIGMGFNYERIDFNKGKNKANINAYMPYVSIIWKF